MSSLALWSAIIGIGEYILLNYEKTPGVLANAPSQWPSGTSIERHPNFMTLLMFVHPHCPCTRASIGELAILMAHCRSRLRADVIFLKPEKFTEDWAKTDIFQMGVEKQQTPVFGCSLMNHKINLFQEIMDLWKNRKEFCLLNYNSWPCRRIIQRASAANL